MPKKTTKRDSEAALRQTPGTAKFAAADGGPAPADPPIIISGGGSVTIHSKVKLHETMEKGKYPYKYYTSEVTVKRIKTKGKKQEEDESNKGVFEVRLLVNDDEE